PTDEVHVLGGHPAPLLLGHPQQSHERRAGLGVARNEAVDVGSPPLPPRRLPVAFGLPALLLIPGRILCRHHRSTSPNTGSTLAMVATMSAKSAPSIMAGMAKVLEKAGPRTLTRRGLFLPLDTTSNPISPRGLSKAWYTSPAGTSKP